MKYLLCLLFLCGACLSSQAQPTTDSQLASYYFQNEEYDKAALYYERLYEKTPNDIFYGYLLKCYFELQDYKQAKKLVKTQNSLFPDNEKYLVDEGRVYLAEGNDRKAEKHFEDLVEDIPPIQNEIKNLANAFSDVGLYDYALKTYMQGRKMLRNAYPFNFEIANVYGDMGNYEGMISEYLSLLLVNESYLQTIQNVLNRNFGFEKESKQNRILKSELLKYIQQHPNRTVFSEMLIWLYIQENNYSGALRQAKAMDNRMRESGQRVIEVSNLAYSNKDYETAIEGFDYVVQKGKQNFNYIPARIRLMEVLDEKIKSSLNYTNEDLYKLRRTYTQTLDDIGRTPQTVNLMRSQAELYAFYLNKTDSAISILESAIEMPRVQEEQLAECKLLLGDVLLTQGNVWDASLYYAQVDKAFKYDVIGEIAKFKNAKIWYYTGDFSLAKSQLDVLKGSTSKLIANDALQLSLLITDNTGLDTSETALKLFAEADLKMRQRQYDTALALLDTINNKFPTHRLADEIHLLKYDYFKAKRKYEEAASELEKILSAHQYDILADDAAFYLGELYQLYLNDEEKAKEYYKMVLTNYTNSLFVIEARKRFRDLRGDQLN